MKTERNLERLEKLIELFEPFILLNEHDFAAENIEKLSYALVPEEQERFGYDTRSLDWWEYWINIHIPALRRWTYPLIEGRPLEARPASQLSTCARKRRCREDRDQRSHVAIFLTGSTGYIGAHVAANLLEGHGAALNVLVRARDPQEAQLRLWRALQLHLDFPRFYEYLQTQGANLLRRPDLPRLWSWAAMNTTAWCTPPIP